MLAADILDERDVNTQNLGRLFKRTFIYHKECDDGDLLAISEGEYPVVISCEDDLKFIHYMCFLTVKESASYADKLILVNDINSSAIFARFSLVRPELILADYFLPFEDGVPAFQVIASYKIFSDSVLRAIRKHDDKGLVTSSPTRS